MFAVLQSNMHALGIHTNFQEYSHTTLRVIIAAKPIMSICFEKYCEQ